MLVLIGLLLLALSLIMFLFFCRRSHSICQRKKQEDEEGRLEAVEARAYMPEDDSLKRAYSPSMLFDSEKKEAEIAKPPPTLAKVAAGVVPHPLYHPGISRSRAHSTDDKLYIQKSQSTPSYPRILSSNVEFRLASTISPNIFRRSENLAPAMSPLTTMSSKVPPAPLPPLQERRSTPITVYLQEAPMKSVWSSPTASVVPSSPSIYSNIPLPHGHVSLRPSPEPRRNSLLVYSTLRGYAGLPRSPTADGRLSEVDKKILASAFAAPPPIPMVQNFIDPFAHRSFTYPPITYSSASSPPASPSLVIQHNPLPDPPSRRPSLAELNAMNDDPALQSSLGIEILDDEVKIERWLGGSTVTASVFGSIFRVDESPRRDMTVPPRRVTRLSPIRAMRPSSARRGSKPKESDMEEARGREKKRGGGVVQELQFIGAAV